MRAFHIVGEDLELRLGIDRRLVAEQKRLVRLLRVRFLRVRAHDDLAVEHRPGSAGQNALVDLMFLPLEPLLAAAFEQDGGLLEQAASLRVIPATPMTLLALLKAVAYGWKQQQLARNAEEIQQLGHELYDRLATMVTHLENVGASIKQAADSYDRFVGSLEQKVLPGARRFKELGVSSTKELELPDPINLTIRRVHKEELRSASAEDADAEPAVPLLDA